MQKLAALLSRLYVSPLTTIAACLLLTTALSSGLAVLHISSDVRDNIEKKNPQYQRLEQMENRYGDSSHASVMLDFHGTLFTANKLDMLDAITRSIGDIDYIRQISGLTSSAFFTTDNDSIEALYLDELIARQDYQPVLEYFAPFAERYTFSPLLSADHQVTAIHLQFDLDDDDPARKKTIIRQLHQWQVDTRAQYPAIDIYLSGMLIADDAQHQAAVRNMQFIFPTIFLVLVIVLWLLLGSITVVAMIMLTVLFSALAMFGTSSLFGIALSPQSLSAGAVVTGMTVATISHIMMAYIRYQPLYKHRDSVKKAVFSNLSPILLASITTVFGFLSMNLSQMPPLRDMGNTSALGIVFSLFYCLVFFPCLLLLSRPQLRSGFLQVPGQWFRQWGAWLLEHPIKKLVVAVLLCAGLAAGNYFNQANDYFVQYYDDSFAFRQANDFADQHLAGLYTLEFDLPPASSNSITSAAYLAELDNFKQWLMQQSEVHHVSTLADVIKMMNQVLHDNKPAQYQIPDSDALIAQYLLLYEISLSDSRVVDQLAPHDRSSSRVIVTTRSMSSAPLLSLEQRMMQWLDDNTTQFSVQQPTSIVLLLTHIVDDVISSGYHSALLALLFISLIMFIVLRPLALGAISLLPNLLPFIIAFGLWGYLEGTIIASSIIVIAITLGIVVDDSIHYLYKVKHAIEYEQLSARDAVIRALEKTGPAIAITTLCLTLAFLVSTLSHFLPSVHFALLTAMILVFALLLDLTLLPLMVYLYFHYRQKSASAGGHLLTDKPHV